jgi:outer membrane protein OmpA-like peptidoglycan-associated protein
MKQSPYTLVNRVSLVILVAFTLLFLPETAKAQQEEVLLTFRYPAVGNVYIGCLYDDKANAVFLPVMELFSLLEINYLPDIKNFTISGNFITPGNTYAINLSAMLVKLGKTTQSIAANDFRISDTEYYLSPQILEKVFGLKFTVEIAPLLLSLETTKSLPVQERKARELLRNRMENRELNQASFPLGYDLKRSILNGTMLDYAITGAFASDVQNLGYTFTGGMEVLGGDIQGTVNGSNSTSGMNSLNTSGLRWRYAIRDNNFLSGVLLGQTSTTGLDPMSIRGIALTNDPVEPRQMYETSMIDGTTEPNSEVEIYVNDRLTGFKRADELGYYRFDVPITYGTTRMSLRIYTPTGRLIVTDKQMQVPFTFLPRGVVSYNIQAGQTENYLSDSIQGRWVAHGNVAVGLTNWLTALAGTQFLGETLASENIMFYSSLSARIAKQYLFNIDAAPNNFYRFTGSVMYANNLNLNLTYTKFDGQSLFNSRGETNNLNANVYLPIRIWGLNTGLRISGEHIILSKSSHTDYSTDFNTRIGKVDIRFNYRDNIESSKAETSFGEGVLTNALTYTIARTPGTPVYVRGTYVRLQNRYNIRSNKMMQSDLELSRTILKTGRLNFIVAYNYLTSSVNTQIGFTLDLNKIRSTTTINTLDNRITARQSFNGSIGWDMQNKALAFSNRQQVGRSAASVLLFVDNNNSGHYDAGDQLLPCRGVKLDRTTTMEVGRDSILRLSQLQSYYKYNMSVNRNAIPDPTLVPIKDKFSFIADPNQYKRIEIPFYRGGTVEGVVLIKRNGMTTGQGGLRLNLKAVGKDFETVVRTMSDGGFYVMDLAPGKYTVEVDSVQQSFLSVKQQPEKFSFEIKALAEGDFLEALNIALTPVDKGSVSKSLLGVNQQPIENKDTIRIVNQRTTLSDTSKVYSNSISVKNQLAENYPNKLDKQGGNVSSNVVKPAVVQELVDKKENPNKPVFARIPAPPVARPTLWVNSPIPPVTMSPVKFPANTSSMSSDLKHFMDTLFDALKDVSWSELVVYGNADSTGTINYNKKISLNRAKQVKAYLVKKGISAKKIIVVGNGEEKPISTNAAKEGRELNRRIDFMLLK